MINAPSKRLEPDSAKSAAWNRGAYLVEALGHCGECHAPRNFMQGLKDSKSFAGANQERWLAYNLSRDKRAGLGGWSDDQTSLYLSTGQAQRRGRASGPMAEVIQYSLRYLKPDDIKAMVAYLRDRPARPDGPPAVQGAPAAVASSDPWATSLQSGLRRLPSARWQGTAIAVGGARRIAHRGRCIRRQSSPDPGAWVADGDRPGAGLHAQLHRRL
jgi:mono/diheme cytochrome c family protein